MSLYCIGYEVVDPGNTYPSLIEEIETYEAWWHCLDSTWIIDSSKTADQVREHLQQYVGLNDRLLVVEIIGNASWAGFNHECSDWLTNIFTPTTSDHAPRAVSSL